MDERPDRYDPKTSPAYSPPARGLGTGVWIGGIALVAAVILGLFLWLGTGNRQIAVPPPPANAGPAAARLPPPIKTQ